MPLKAYRQMCIYSNLAKIYTETGNLEKSVAYFAKAAAVCSSPAFDKEYKSYDYLTVLLNLAESYNNLHKTDSANLQCKTAEYILKGNRDSILHSYIIEEQGLIFKEKKEFKKAIQQIKHALRLRGVSAETLAVNEDDAAIVNLGDLYSATSEYALADAIYKKELNKFRKAGVEATNIFRETVASLTKNLIYQNKYNEAFDSLLVLSTLALTAIDKNFAGMTEDEQLKFSASFSSFFDIFFTLLIKKPDLPPKAIKEIFVLELKVKNLVLNNQAGLLKRIRNTEDTALANLYTALINTRQILAKQYSLPYTDRLLNTDSIQGMSDALEKQASLKWETIGFENNNGVFNKFLQQDTSVAFIDFMCFNYIAQKSDEANKMYAAFVFKGGDTLPVFVPLFSARAMLKLIHNANGKPMGEAQLTQKIYAKGSNGARLLYHFIWQPLEKYLTGVTAINYSTAGILNNISFHALNNSKGYLANSYTLRRFLNLDAAKMVDAVSVPQAISLWGNMVYDANDLRVVKAHGHNAYVNSISTLAASGIKPSIQSKSISKEPLQAFQTDEIMPIQKLFSAHNIPVIYNKQKNASEENFKAQAANIQGVLHISTHGFYTPLDKSGTNNTSPGSFIAGNANPLFRCGLAFAGVNYYWMKGVPQPGREDGILTGYEVSQLDLHNVQLVTLSACETGLGDVTANEGNLGMQRAFKLAGAKNLLVSLWQVPAKATQQMLTKLYTYWLQGNSLSKALQMAECDTQKIHPEPFYWAGFVLLE